MASKTIRAIRLPDGSSILNTLIAQVSQFSDGIGILNERSRMIGWIQITGSTADSTQTKFDLALDALYEVISNPNNARQPDWSFLADDPKL